MAKCHGCTLVINQSYWFEILQTIIKSLEGWGQVIIFLLLELTLLDLMLVFAVFIRVVTRVHSWYLPWSIYRNYRDRIEIAVIKLKLR